MRIRLLIFIVFILCTAALNAQTINLRLSTYFYSWQRIDSINNPSSNKTTHIQGYQSLFLDVNKNKWSFNTLLQTEEDVIHRIDRGFSYRFFNLYVKSRIMLANDPPAFVILSVRHLLRMCYFMSQDAY